jgi:hypothetical protein
MCVTSERHSSICWHIAAHTKLSAEKKSQVILKIFHSRCKLSKMKTIHYELWDDCRQFWQAHGVSESEAIQRTGAYRAQYNYFGPLSPFNDSGNPVLMGDIGLGRKSEEASKARHVADSIDQVAGRESQLMEWLTSGGNPLDVVQRAKRYEEDLTERMIKQTIREPLSSINKSSASIHTLWPKIPIQPSEDAKDTDKGDGKEGGSDEPIFGDIPDNLRKAGGLIHPDEFELDELSTGLQSEATLQKPGYFELETSNKPPPVKIHADGFERQVLPMPSPRRPIRKSFLDRAPSRQDAEKIDSEVPNLGKIPQDLDKPLPPPPRRDTPMPGRPFDGQNPERDLPYRMYIPRAF